jgi:hypothetical protein
MNNNRELYRITGKFRKICGRQELYSSSVSLSWYSVVVRVLLIHYVKISTTLTTTLYKLNETEVQTGSEAHPASCTMGIGGPFPGAKHGRGVTLTAHPHLVSRSRMSRSYTSSPQAPQWRVAGPLCFAFCLFITLG